MRIDEIAVDWVHITLSRRNLLTLLANLAGHPPDTDRSLYRLQEPGWPILQVTVESDVDHYRDRPTPPGRMHPEIERWINERG